MVWVSTTSNRSTTYADLILVEEGLLIQFVKAISWSILKANVRSGSFNSVPFLSLFLSADLSSLYGCPSSSIPPLLSSLLPLTLCLSLSCAFSGPITLSDSFQMDVVSAFQSGISFQAAVRRQPSSGSQQHDVTNVSSPTHVALSPATAFNTASATVGCECAFISAWQLTFPPLA